MLNLQIVAVEPKKNSIKYKGILTEELFLDFCQDHYFNPECSGKNEFIDDLKRIKYVKRLIQKIHKKNSSLSMDSLFSMLCFLFLKKA